VLGESGAVGERVGVVGVGGQRDGRAAVVYGELGEAVSDETSCVIGIGEIGVVVSARGGGERVIVIELLPDEVAEGVDELLGLGLLFVG
jgi:hypothetical protein